MTVLRFPDPRLPAKGVHPSGAAADPGGSEDRPVWPDVTLASLEALQAAFTALNAAPGYSPVYHEAQTLIARAHEVLKATLE